MPTKNEILQEIEDRLRDDLTEEDQYALATILGEGEVTMTLPLHEWAALITAIETFEPVMDEISTNGAMRRDVMPIVAKVNTFMEEYDDAVDDLAPILAKLEAGGYLKPKEA